MRMFVAVLVAMALALAGCGSDDGDDATSATTTEESGGAATTSAEVATPLDGTWRTEPITLDDMARTLREQGLGKRVDDFEKNAPISDAPTTLILEVRDGNWDLEGQAEGGEPKPIDFDAEYEVKGNTVIVIHADGSRTLRWSVKGDVLTLTSLNDSLSPTKGIPDEVFQTALYMTAEFQRS
jgi:hypothetical protein